MDANGNGKPPGENPGDSDPARKLLQNLLNNLPPGTIQQLLEEAQRNERQPSAALGEQLQSSAAPVLQQPSAAPVGERPSATRGGQQPSAAPSGQQPSAAPVGERPSATRGGQQPSAAPVGERPSAARGGQQFLADVKENVPWMDDCMDDNQPSSSGFRDRSYNPGYTPGFGNSQQYPAPGHVGGSSFNRSTNNDPRDRLAFSKTVANVYSSKSGYEKYEDALVNGTPEGTQRIQCATPRAKVKMMELFDDVFVASMDDNTFPRISINGIESFLSSTLGDFCFTVFCKTTNLAPYCLEDRWNRLLTGVKSITALGTMNENFCRALLAVDPGNTVESVCISPTNAMELPIAQLCGLLPASTSFLTLDARKFARGDMVTSLQAVCDSRFNNSALERLLLLADQFPVAHVLTNSIEMLENVSTPTSCITLLTSSPASDDCVTSARGNGFVRGHPHRRAQNEVFEMYIADRGQRLFLVGFKQP